MTGTSTVEDGVAAAARGEWQAARDALLAAPGIDCSVAGLEALITACWWLEDGDCYVRARESLYVLHRDRGEYAAAAAAAVRLSWEVDVATHDATLARAWLDRARSLVAHGGGDALVAAWCDLREASLHVVDEPEATLAAARAVRAEARALGSFDLEALALVYEAHALLALGEIDAGLRPLEEATLAVCTGETTDTLPATLAPCWLLEVCAGVRDYARASTWLPRIVERSAVAERGTMAVIGRCTSVPLLLGRGLWLDAAAAIEDGLAHFDGRHESWERSLCAALAELRYREGRIRDAEALLDRAEPDRRCRLTRAAIALDRGDPAAARDQLEAFLRQTSHRVALDRGAAFELLALTRTALGDRAGAASARAALAAFAEKARTPALRAAVHRVDAASLRAAGDAGGAARELRDAVDLLTGAGATYEAAVAGRELADALEACGRSAEAERARASAAAGRAEAREPLRRSESCPLTARELEVLALVRDGLPNARIAERLVVSPHTVHRHMANILARLGCPTRAAAVAAATEAGWLRRAG